MTLVALYALFTVVMTTVLWRLIQTIRRQAGATVREVYGGSVHEAETKRVHR